MYLKFRSLCKRVGVLALSMAMLFLLVSCGSNQENDTGVDAESAGDLVESTPVGEADDDQTQEPADAGDAQLQEATGTGDEQTQEPADAGDGQTQEATDTSDEQSQKPPETGDDQTQEPADTSDDQSQEPADAGEDQPDNASDGNAEGSPLSIGDKYEEILLSDGGFYCADLDNKELSLSGIREAITDDDSITAKATKFTVIDLDNDGANEIVLWLQINDVSDYGFEVLRYLDGNVYGYTLQYRSFMNLKTDGTFEFSGSASDTGVGKLGFSDAGCFTENLAYSESGYDDANELTVQYYANGKACSEEEFNDFVGQQGDKADVDWFDLTEGGVGAAFENKF